MIHNMNLITRCGNTVLVDNDIYEAFKGKSIFLHQGYPHYNCTVNGKRQKKALHRFVNQTPDGMQTDHVNGNILDNRRENLRTCSPAENGWNKGKRSGKLTSKYKGVDYRKNGMRCWRARIRVGDRRINLGQYATEKEAAQAYNEAAIKYHGKFANLNEIT